MKKFGIFFFLFVSLTSGADVIFTPDFSRGLYISIEGIGSYEIALTNKHTINLWGGGGFVSDISNLSRPDFGEEVAVELRHYFSPDKYSGINLGLYSGLAFMKYSLYYRGRFVRRESLVGFIPGLKLAYKYRINNWLVGEPYVGLSIPVYKENLKELSDGIMSKLKNDPGLRVTIGIRIGINKVRSKIADK